MKSLTPIETWYDTVIKSQADFEEWCAQLDASTYTGTSVLILNGSYTLSDNKYLLLPEGLKEVRGIGEVVINGKLSGASNNFYVVNGSGRECTVINITVKAQNTSTYSLIGFYKVKNLINCKSICGGSGGAGQSQGFRECENLYNCYGEGSGSTNNGYGFNACKNLVNCEGYGVAASGNYTGYGFYECENMVNCTGVGSGNYGVSSKGYAFYSCKICSNCLQDPDHTSTTATWGGTNTDVDPDTCPEYTDTRSFPPTPTQQDNGKLLGVVDTKLTYVAAGSGISSATITKL